MKPQEALNYRRVADAINFIRARYRSQPGLEEIAGHVGVSPAHFQRMFTDLAGTSPKQFLKHVTMQHAQQLLKAGVMPTSSVAYETGLSSSSRLHDLFISIEGMTPAEYKHGGRALRINYRLEETPFGSVLIASTDKGICCLEFAGKDEKEALKLLTQRFPNAAFEPGTDAIQQQALSIFRQDWDHLPKIKLHLRGTPFQFKVWECLLKIPFGVVSTYGNVASQIDAEGASRAVGTAIGRNPVAFLIPCHRVIRSDGETGGYRWGTLRKQLLLTWEEVVVDVAGAAYLASPNRRS